MKIFTTINPNGNFESQNEAISSWSNRYNVYSVNTRKEIESIKDIYPNVIFIETNDTFNYNGKKLIKLNSILSSIEEISENETVAIVNSDIILNEDIELNINKRYLFSINHKNNILYTNNNHLSNELYKKYMRVKTKDGIVGEICDINNETLTIEYSNTKISGWNLQQNFEKTNVLKENVTLLDNGLNSEWLCDIQGVLKQLE